MSVGKSLGGGYKKKGVKYDISKDVTALAPVTWDKSRPQPNFMPGVWEKEEIMDLERYVDWHRSHPHCVTPRLIKDDEEWAIGDKKIDQGNPKLLYTRQPGMAPPTPEQYKPLMLGGSGLLQDVSDLASVTEYSRILENKYDNEDPWYAMSVKDQLEQYHVDGSHTTVTRRKKATAESTTAFSREVAWKAERYGSYAGGGPTPDSVVLAAMAEAALGDKSLQNETLAVPKKSPWTNEKIYSKYTSGGTALLDYQKLALHKNIEEALNSHKDEVKKEKKTQKMMSQKSRRNAIFPAEQQTPGQGFELMSVKLGDAKTIEKMNLHFIRLAKKVAKHSKTHSNMLDTRMDLVEACLKLRVLKVTAMLLNGSNPNMKTPEDEPVFIHMLDRACQMDLTGGHTRTDDKHRETPDRKKILKILQTLASFGANLNIFGREGYTAGHLVAKFDNSKLALFLLEKGANLGLFSKNDDLTPLMVAAKFGHLYVCADILRKELPIDTQNESGHTALHLAARFGQTRTSIFLLRLGAQKLKQDFDFLTPARLAEESGFILTSQAIAAYATRGRDVSQQLGYLKEQEVKREDERSRMSERRSMSGKEKVLGGMGLLGKWAKAWAGRGWAAAGRHWQHYKKEVCDYLEIDVYVKEEGEESEEEEEESSFSEGMSGGGDRGSTSGDKSGSRSGREGTAESRAGTAASVVESGGEGVSGSDDLSAFIAVENGGRGVGGVGGVEDGDAVIGFDQEF